MTQLNKISLEDFVIEQINSKKLPLDIKSKKTPVAQAVSDANSSPEQTWLGYDLQANTVDLLSRVEKKSLNQYITEQSARIGATNYRLFKFYDEENKKALNKKIATLLLALNAQQQRRDILLNKSYQDLEQHCRALLTLLNNDDDEKAKEILNPAQPLNAIERIDRLVHYIIEQIKIVFQWLYQSIVAFYRFIVDFNFSAWAKESYNALVAFNFIQWCSQLYESFRSSILQIIIAVRDTVRKIINDPTYRDEIKHRIATFLHKSFVFLDQLVAILNSERVSWSFDDTTPLSAARGIIQSQNFNPLHYNSSLAKANLDAVGSVTGHLSWIAPSLRLISDLFRLWIEAHYFELEDSEQQDWMKVFWAAVPESTKQKLAENLIWTIVNTVSFWLSFGLEDSSIVYDKLTIEGVGLVINIAGMLLQLAIQVKQLGALTDKFEGLVKQEIKLRDSILVLEKGQNIADLCEKKLELKLLRAEIRELSLQKKSLLLEILTVTLGILAGMVLMSLGPFASILPAIGSIVNSLVILAFTIGQHWLKISSIREYQTELTQEIDLKIKAFEKQMNESKEPNDLLFLEILELEYELKNQNNLYKEHMSIAVRTVAVKFCMQLLIFFAMSIAPLYIALACIGIGMIETKLLEFLTTNLYTTPLEPVPEVGTDEFLTLMDERFGISKKNGDEQIVSQHDDAVVPLAQ